MKRLIRNALILATAGAGMILISAPPHADANTGADPVEIGTAMFLRDHHQAMELAKQPVPPALRGLLNKESQK